MTGTLTSLFAIGTIIGSFFFGYLSDKINRRFMILAPLMIGTTIMLLGLWLITDYYLVCVMVPLVGMFIGSAANMVSGAISTDLADESELKSEVMASISGIINGIGGIGAAIGMFVVRDN